MEGHKSIRNFFKYLLVGFLISSARVSLKGMAAIEVIQIQFLTFMYNLIAGIGTGIAMMFGIVFGIEFYYLIKKN